MSGISANTAERLLRNLAGTLTVNGVAMGAYEEGDVSFTPELEYDSPQFGGAWGVIEGTEMVTLAGGRLKVKMKEGHYAALQVFFGDLGYDSAGTSEVFGSTNYGTTPFRKILKNVVFTGAVRGGPAGTQAIVITMASAVIAPPPLTFPGKSSAGFEIEFEARYTAAAPSTYPVKIEIAKPT